MVDNTGSPGISMKNNSEEGVGEREKKR